MLGGGESVGSLWSCCRAAGGADTDREKETDQETTAPLGCAQSAAKFCRFDPLQRSLSPRTEPVPSPRTRQQDRILTKQQPKTSERPSGGKDGTPDTELQRKP